MEMLMIHCFYIEPTICWLYVFEWFQLLSSMLRYDDDVLVIWDMNTKVWLEVYFDEGINVCVLNDKYESMNWAMFWLSFKVWWE
jgi:hypothetical protein